MSKVRLGVIGAGWWATVNHIPLLRERNDVELVAVCSLGEELLRQVKDIFGFAYSTQDYRELLALGLDGVIISSPHHLHFEHASAALRRNLHVLCEKPLTLRPEDAWGLVALARERDRHLIVPYGWHYKEFVQQAKQVMDDGAVGQIEYVMCHMASPTKSFFSGAGGVPSRWRPTVAEPNPSTWQVKEHGGGYGHGQITHSSALMFWLTGLRAEAVTALVTSPNSAVDLYDAAAVKFQGGAIGTVSGAATLPDDERFQVDIRIFGEKGVLLLDVERERLEVRRHDGHHRHFDVSPGEGAYSCEVPPHRFVDLILGRGINESPGEVAARSVELIDAVYRSAAEGGIPVEI